MAQPGGLGLAMPGVPAGAGGAPAPPGGGGGTLPGGTAVPPPPPPPRDYRSRFGNPELDSYGGDYAGLQAVFAAQAPAGMQPPQPAGLLRRAQAYSSRPASQAYVALIDRGGGVRVETFLNPSPHADLPGLPPSGYDGQTIAQLGDVRRSRDGYVSLSAVTLVATNFRLANQGAPCTVPTVDTVDALLAAAGDPAVGLGPFAVGAADTQQVRTRHMIPIGASLASLCVHQRPTPPEFWRTVCAHLRSSGAMAMLCGGIDTAIGRLRGRWQTDTMFRYLTVQAAPLVADVAPRMLHGDDFNLIPGPKARTHQGPEPLATWRSLLPSRRNQRPTSPLPRPRLRPQTPTPRERCSPAAEGGLPPR